MANLPSDGSVLKHIEDLVAEEHHLMQAASSAPSDHERLTQLQVQLDQYWDLLRQRRALRETGHPVTEAVIRPPGTVENYEG